MIVLGLDPGTRKCGFAVISQIDGPALAMGIIPIEALAERLLEIVTTTPVAIAAIGRGTNAAVVADAVSALGMPFELIDERETSLLARARFFRDHPPRGWRRLIPTGMQLPNRPIDDYAALLIAERFLKASV